MIAGAGSPARPNSPPMVQITSPKSGTKVVAGTKLTFTGVATDAEEGSLAAGITWISSLHGVIGYGSSFSTTGLRDGAHIITALVSDAKGATASTSIAVTIASRVKLTVRALKSKAKNYGALSWSQAASTTMGIYRNGIRIKRMKTKAAGSFKDSSVNSKLKTATYKVCSVGTTYCSNQVAVK